MTASTWGRFGFTKTSKTSDREPSSSDSCWSSISTIKRLANISSSDSGSCVHISITSRLDILNSCFFKGFVQNTELSDGIFQCGKWIISYCIVIFDVRKTCFLDAILHGLVCNLILC